MILESPCSLSGDTPGEGDLWRCTDLKETVSVPPPGVPEIPYSQEQRAKFVAVSLAKGDGQESSSWSFGSPHLHAGAAQCCRVSRCIGSLSALSGVLAASRIGHSVKSTSDLTAVSDEHPEGKSSGHRKPKPCLEFKSPMETALAAALNTTCCVWMPGAKLSRIHCFDLATPWPV